MLQRNGESGRHGEVACPTCGAQLIAMSAWLVEL
jgi:hypothetical protein